MSTHDSLVTAPYEPPPAAAHPLSSLDSTELIAVRDIIATTEQFSDNSRFAFIGLEEPTKGDILAWEADQSQLPDRQARAWLADLGTGDSTDFIVSITTGNLISSTVVDGSQGQFPVVDDESMAAITTLYSDPQWAQALAKRGLVPTDVQIVPLSAGSFGIPGEDNTRLVRCLAFQQNHPTDHIWAHPIDGLSVYLDVAKGEVRDIIDHHSFDVPTESGNFDDPEVQGPPLEGLRPIDIVQPEGASFTVDGEHISWANWKFRIGFDVREGLILRQLTFTDNGTDRPIMYRGSISEMVVPYGDPSHNRFWQNYFDTGEFMLGRFTNSLALGCDCVGEIKYFDTVFSDQHGVPQTVKNGICMHEEDFGALWKHSDLWTGSREVRRSRRLVISSFVTLGNYDYGFFWYLYLDGTIEFEAKLTGVVFTSAFPGNNEDGTPYPYASHIAPGLGGPNHQHIFSARLDMTIDGLSNTVNEIDAVRVPISPDNPYGNAFTKSVTPIETELDSGRLADGSKGRVWQVASTDHTNRMGLPTSYILHPTESPTLMMDPESPIAGRAAFGTKNLFVTKYDPTERYAAGDLVNQSPQGQGIPQFIAGNEQLIGEDLVLWHSFGLTHFPRAEDWPVMPMDYAGFSLKPYNFFERNPSLNVPTPTTRNHCHPPSA
jgi:primary-amine oxidase